MGQYFLQLKATKTSQYILNNPRFYSAIVSIRRNQMEVYPMHIFAEMKRCSNYDFSGNFKLGLFPGKFRVHKQGSDSTEFFSEFVKFSH